MKSVVEQACFREFAFDTKRLKHLSDFKSGENVWSSNVVEFKFELYHIPSDDVIQMKVEPLL